MRRLLTFVCAVLFCAAMSAQDLRLDVPGVTVLSERPMKSIGLHETRLDTTALQESIALSMADILTYNTSVFVKSHGRATLSTVAFRGTSPSHTQVTWNGIGINSPMLGMTDFSTIPAYFIDDAALLHGTSSVNLTGGGLGGAVRLATVPQHLEGTRVQYVQGIGSFGTADEYLRLSYGNDKWQLSTRAVSATSPNRYPYRNRDKKENIYDDTHHIIGQYYPKEKNRSGSFNDLHLLQEVYYTPGDGGRWGGQVWYFASNREIPLLTTDYGTTSDFENRQREETLRSHFSYTRNGGQFKTEAAAGYMHTWMAYDYKRDAGNGILTPMTRSRSTLHTIYGQAETEYSPHHEWLFTADVTARQHFVRSVDKNIILQDGNRAVVGYDKGRFELSGAVSGKWRPTPLAGISVVLREEMYGDEWAPLIPALFAEHVVAAGWSAVLQASVSRNYRFPSLNDLFFLPGGNPALKPESGFTWDVGMTFARDLSDKLHLDGNVNWFSSQIDDWILWLPTTKGFFSPRNVRKVHAYGIESQLHGRWQRPRVTWDLAGNFSWTPSVNQSDPVSPADQSVGKQLPYVPERSASVVGQMILKKWNFTYKWCYYSRRHTMSSNDFTLTGQLPAYFMSDISLSRSVSVHWADLSFRASVENLFDEEYISVLAHPMPGIHYEFFIGITPRW